jgi:hypothetical protein
MKLSDYPTPQVDELWQKTGSMSKAQEPIWDLATQLEQRIAHLHKTLELAANTLRIVGDSATCNFLKNLIEETN